MDWLDYGRSFKACLIFEQACPEYSQSPTFVIWADNARRSHGNRKRDRVPCGHLSTFANVPHKASLFQASNFRLSSYEVPKSPDRGVSTRHQYSILLPMRSKIDNSLIIGTYGRDVATRMPIDARVAKFTDASAVPRRGSPLFALMHR